MRNRVANILKRNFRTAIIQHRRDFGLTQEQMAQKLGISLRCYCNLESGKSCCSGVTLMLFLQICEDPMALIEDTRREMEEETTGGI